MEQEVSLCGQSRETSDEGLQDELDVWVLAFHPGLHLRRFLERGCAEESCFPKANPHVFDFHSFDVRAFFVDLGIGFPPAEQFSIPAEESSTHSKTRVALVFETSDVA